jgi:hypothetical protein
MVASRCARQTFAETSCFHYNNQPRQVRVWDEAMLRGEIVSLNTDDLNCLPQQFRGICPALGDFAGRLANKLLPLKKGMSFEMPNVADATGVDQSMALSQCNQKQLDSFRSVLENLYALSGQTVRLSKGNGRVITALNIRDARPKDLGPILVLDASGRVRFTYKAWEKGPGGLIRLKSATKEYSNLSIKIMDKGGGKSSWIDKGELYVGEIAKLINSKPEEDWLVIYHASAMNGRLPNALRELINANKDRVRLVNWGAHQGRNDFGHIRNVILAGTLFYPEHQYEGLAYMSAGIPTTTSIPEALVRNIRLGEHMDLILQGLCRASVRGSIGRKCKPCTAYIIASKASGIRAALPTVFPGCRITRWTALPSAARGKVAEAIAMLKSFKLEHPEDTLLFSDMMARLGIGNRSNFNKTIRRHEQFKEAMAELDANEVSIGGGRYKDAFSFTFGPLPDATYVRED